LNHKQNEQQVDAYTNFLGEFFSDLIFGTSIKKLECFKGSFHFNGSCYFVSSNSSRQYSLKLLKIFRKNKKLSDFLDDTPFGVASELATLPIKSTWNEAFTSCSKLNNDSAIFEPANSNMDEFDFIVNLLKNISFPNSNDASNQEKKYLIGLKHNSNNFYLFYLNVLEQHLNFMISQIQSGIGQAEKN
jgi:hypothetical protein